MECVETKFTKTANVVLAFVGNGMGLNQTEEVERLVRTDEILDRKGKT